MKNKTNFTTILIVVMVMFLSLIPIETFASELKVSKNSNIKYLKSSLNLTTKNIDMKSIHDTNPLNAEQIDYLESIGYEYQHAITKDYGDYKKIFAKEKMNARTIKSAKSLYPELANKGLSKWTNGDFELYIQQKNDELFRPTDKQEKELKSRGIGLEDARYLLKDFYSYSNILLQSDGTLKEYLENYYQFKNNYVESLKSIERKNSELRVTNQIQASDNIVIMAAPPLELQGTTYIYVENFPNYGNDWFHVDSGTHVADSKYWFAEAASNAYSLIYGSIIPRYSNLWGTYSGSQNGAHEGIDFLGLDQTQLKSPVTGEVIYKAYDYIAVYDTQDFNYDFSLFFYHMSNVSVNQGDTLAKGTIMGRQSNIGNAEGSHLHFAVENGRDTTTTSARNDHNLDSASPYIFW